MRPHTSTARPAAIESGIRLSACGIPPGGYDNRREWRHSPPDGHEKSTETCAFTSFTGVRAMHTLSRVLSTTTVIFLLLTSQYLFAAEGRESTPKDTCILELNLPAGATVTVDGRDYGTKRKLTFRGLKPKARYLSKVTVRFKGGGEKNCKIAVEGGQHICLALPSPASTRPELVLQAGHTEEIKLVDFSPDGRYVVSGSSDRVILWDRATGRKLRAFSTGTARPKALSFSPDGKKLAVCGTSMKETGSFSQLWLWDVNNGWELVRIDSIQADLRTIAFSPDGRLLAAAGDRYVHAPESRSEGVLVVWDAETGKPVHPMRPLGKDKFWTVAFSPGGDQLILSTVKQTFLYDLKERRVTSSFQEETHSRPFSRDGQRWVTSGRRSLTVRDAATGKPLHTIRDPGDRVDAVAMSPDGRLVLTVNNSYGEPGMVLLWDAATGVTRHIHQSHQGEVLCAAFSPDSRHVLSGSKDKTALLWDAQTGKLLNERCGGSRDLRKGNSAHAVMIGAARDCPGREEARQADFPRSSASSAGLLQRRRPAPLRTRGVGERGCRYRGGRPPSRW